MRLTSRAAWALGLGLCGAAWLATGQTRGQSDGAAQSAEPQKQNGQVAVTPARIACIDIGRILEEYKKVKFNTEQIEADMKVKHGELSKLATEMQQKAAQLNAIAQGSPEYKDRESELTKMKVEFEAQREQAQAEFTRREAESMASLYKDVEKVVGWVAQRNGITQVIRIETETPPSSDPRAVFAASWARTVVYSDPSADITNMVIYYLNAAYEKQTQGAATQPEVSKAPATRDPNAARTSATDRSGAAARPQR